MKKPLPMPAIIAAVVVVLAGIIFGIMKVNAGTAEFEKPKVAPGIPDYIKAKMSPDALKKLEEQGVDTSVNAAPPTGQPTAAPGK